MLTLCQTTPLPRLRDEPMTQTWPIRAFHSPSHRDIPDRQVTQVTPLKLKSKATGGTLCEAACTFLWRCLITAIGLELLGATHEE